MLQIVFDNDDMDGQMLLSLDADPIRLVCQGDVDYKSEFTSTTLLQPAVRFTNEFRARHPDISSLC